MTSHYPDPRTIDDHLMGLPCDELWSDDHLMGLPCDELWSDDQVPIDDLTHFIYLRTFDYLYGVEPVT